MSGCCISLKSWCSELTAEKIETCGFRIDPIYFKIAAAFAGLTTCMFIIAGTGAFGGTVGSMSLKLATRIGICAGTLTTWFFVIVISLAISERNTNDSRRELKNIIRNRNN